MDILVFRNDLVRAIRSYFHDENVLEVTTPLLRESGAVEVHLDSVRTVGEPGCFLQTSPEYAMKALVAKYGYSIFQICPAVRGGEQGSRHRVEFQMLEWYRRGFELGDLASDLRRLLNHIGRTLEHDHELNVGLSNVAEVSYKHLFVDAYGINPHQATRHELSKLATRMGLTHLAADCNDADYLDGLFAAGIEASLEEPVIVTDYPACQAALAEVRVDAAGDMVSTRFELIMCGLEIANAYQELDDHRELQERLGEFNRQRQQLGKVYMEPDRELLAATGSIGTYSGIALGLDRLAMVLLGLDSIDQVTL